MNYKMLFMAIIVFGFNDLNARYYEDFFSEWGRSLDEAHDRFMNFESHSAQAGVTDSFILEKTENRVQISLDTGKRVITDDIDIMHKKNSVSVKIKGLDKKLELYLKSSPSLLNISMCSESIREKKDVHEYHSYQGASCMQQIMSIEVDLSAITAEYQDTKLILSIPVIQPDQGTSDKGKKVPVTVKSTPIKNDSSVAKVVSAPDVQADVKQQVHDK